MPWMKTVHSLLLPCVPKTQPLLVYLQCWAWIQPLALLGVAEVHHAAGAPGPTFLRAVKTHPLDHHGLMRMKGMESVSGASEYACS